LLLSGPSDDARPGVVLVLFLTRFSYPVETWARMAQNIT
jgi:hypothetical protein